MRRDRNVYIKTIDGSTLKFSQGNGKKYRTAKSLARKNKSFLVVLPNGRVCICPDSSENYTLSTTQTGIQILVHKTTLAEVHGCSVKSVLRRLGKNKADMEIENSNTTREKQAIA